MAPRKGLLRRGGSSKRKNKSRYTFGDNGDSSHLSAGASSGYLSIDSDSWSAFFRNKLSDVVPTSMPRTESVRTVSSASIEMTVTQLRFIPGRLYGREKEIAAVKETLDNETKLQQVLLITGTSGVGKTVLADKLRAPALRAGGRYVMGKHDAMHRSEPYSGITAACRSLCEDLVHKPPASERLEKLREELGSSVHVLAKLIPTILQVVGVDASQDDDGGIAEAQNRFQYAIKRFLRIVASWGPLVFLLDDLQWADIESLQLLEVLVKDRDIEGLVVVGCYRSNEVDETHMFAKWIRDVEALKEEVLVSKIFLQNLEVEAVNQMLADLLSTEKEKTQDLAGIVHKKTLGNAFFVVQFLKMLTEQDVLAYNLGIMKWVWSVEDIEHNTKATENVVDLMEKKMTGLPSKLAEILPLAACLGSTFQKQSLTVVADVLFRHRGRSVPGQESFGTDEWLESCGEEGFIETAGSKSYRWVHDKIQEAALALIVPEKLPFLRYRVGEVLLRNLSDDELQRNAFVVSNLLNEASARTIINEATQLKIAEVNLEAGHRAIASASFGQAVLYLQRGIQRLPTDHWETQYDLSLELFSCAAEAEYCTGDVERMEEHCNAIIKQKDRPLPEKFRAYNILVDSMGNRNKLGEAMELILDVLETLDCKLPKGRYLFHTLAGIGRIKLTIKKYTPEDIARLGEMEDESQKEAMRLLDQLASHAYMAEHPLLPLAIFKSLRLSIQHGISEYSPPAFATVGLILCGNLGDLQGGKIYGEAALSLLDSIDFESIGPRTFFVAYGFVLHWTTMIQDMMKPLLRAYDGGLAVGDVESAIWSITFYLELALNSGRVLGALEQDYQIYTRQMSEFKQQNALGSAKCMWQAVLNLMGRSEHTYKMKGEVADEDELLEKFRREGNINEGTVRQIQLMLRAFFIADESGGDLVVDMAETPPKISQGTHGYCFFRMNCALVCYGAARKTKKKANKYLKLAKQNHAVVKGWVKAGNPNFIFANYLLDAEAAIHGGKKASAIKNYESAAASAARSGFRSYHALIQERTGDIFEEMGDHGEAVYRWKNALPIYEEWGADAKVVQLQEKLARFS